MRLIDVEEAIRISKDDKFMWAYDLTDLEEFLMKEVPPVDAVEVVRCFDCEYSFDWDRDEPEADDVWVAGSCNLREADEVIVTVYACDFCSYGKRRQNG